MKPIGHEKNIPCNQYHMINGEIPPIEPTSHTTQHPDLMGKLCDCKKFIYSEGVCGCPSEDLKWEVKWIANPNY